MRSTENDDFKKLKTVDTDYSDASMVLIRQWYEYYGEKFLESDLASFSLSEKQRNEVSFILSNFCDFCYSYYLQKPGQWTKKAVMDVCMNIMPRKVMADENYFSAIVPTLCNFLTWMSEGNHLPNTDPLKKAILSVESDILDHSKNSDNWGIGKSLMMGALAKGYDTQNPRAIEAALNNENVDDLLLSATQMMKNMRPLPKEADEIQSLEDIVNDLHYSTLGFPKAAVLAALSRQSEITPVLFEFLNEAIECHQSLKEHFIGHLYAIFILAQFREKETFPFIIKLISLPEDILEFLIGDVITEDMHNIIASVYNGDLSTIHTVIENSALWTWSRNAAIRSLLTLVREEILEREQVVQYFKTLFNHPAFIDDEMAMTHLVNASCDLYPFELYDEIKNAFERNKVDTMCLDMKWINSVLKLGQEYALKKYLFINHYEFIYDVINKMEWWACFQGPETQNDDVEFYNSTQIPPDCTTIDNLPYRRETAKIGRNDPCPCGSNKKFKKCCLNYSPVLH